ALLPRLLEVREQSVELAQREIGDRVVTAILQRCQGDALSGSGDAADEDQIQSAPVLHQFLLTLYESFGAVDATLVEHEVPTRRLDEHREVAAGCDGNRHFAD